MLYSKANKYAKFSIKGTVLVDNQHVMASDIMVETIYGTLNVSPCNDVLSKSWYNETCCVEYTKGHEIVIQCDIQVDTDYLNLIIVPKKVQGGTLNVKQYEELCKKPNLAFFKYSNGHMSGLFA
jgi:hypothetical protein